MRTDETSENSDERMRRARITTNVVCVVLGLQLLVLAASGPFTVAEWLVIGGFLLGGALVIVALGIRWIIKAERK
jgi:hypothetical protein